jgi:hypothetical protein
MSTPRRMFEDPRNTYIIDNNDPGAFDKRFVGRPGVHREQRCCSDCAPAWQTHLIHDGDDPGDGNQTAYREMNGIQVEDATGESDNVSGRNQTKGYVWVEGPKSGYKPDFISVVEWMNWQSVYWIPSPHPVPNLPNPPRWVRLPGERKVRWGDSGNYECLWCQRCETWLERAWSDILDAIPIAARGLAMIASYIPVYGTALSLVINTTVSLAEGETVDQSLVDGIGGALPGQPTSGMVYKAGVAVAKGERLDHVAIDALNLDKSVTDVLKAADEALYSIATGQRINDVVYSAVHQFLPPEAQQGMDYARRFINGENVPEMILSQAEQVVADSVKNSARSLLEEAKARGGADLSAAEAMANTMFNQYAVEFGYQMAHDRLADDARGWIQLGMAGGAALTGSAQQFVGTFGSIPETNTAANDSYAGKGQTLISSGIKYRTKLVSDILKQSKFAIVIDFYDSLNSVWTKRTMNYDITDAWRRGFTIAIGVCQGSSVRGPGQLAVYQTLAEAGERDGFDAGQAVQYNRTLYGDIGLPLTDVIEQKRTGESPFLQALRDSKNNP